MTIKQELPKGLIIYYSDSSSLGSFGGKPYPEMDSVNIEIELNGTFFGQLTLRGIRLSQMQQLTGELYFKTFELIKKWLELRGYIWVK